jgi:hypothetical protein
VAATSELARVPGFEQLDLERAGQLEALDAEEALSREHRDLLPGRSRRRASTSCCRGSAKAFPDLDDGKDRIVRVLKPATRSASWR